MKRIACAVAVVSVLVACTPLPAPDNVSETTAASAPLPVATETASRVFELSVFATHPNGTQLRVDRVEILEGVAVVEGGLTNGSLYGIRIDRGLTELRLDSGQTAPLMGPVHNGEIAPGTDLDLTLRFELPAQPAEVILALNVGGGSSPVDPFTSVPSFQLGPLALDAGATRPELPRPVSIDRSLVHPLGTEVQITGLSFTPTRIGVRVRIANPAEVELALAPTIAPTYLVDDLSNRYPLLLPLGDTAIRVPAGEARTGVLSFAGRIDPEASTLTLALNDGPGGDTGGPTVGYPRLRIEEIPLTGEVSGAPLPTPMTLEATLDHPNGVQVLVRELRFTSSAIEADLIITNNAGSVVGLAANPTFLFDDLGSRYPIVPPPENPELVMDPGTVIEGTFRFSGRLAADATEVSLEFNEGGSADSTTSQLPSFLFGSYPVTRPPTTETTGRPPVFAVGPRSALFDATLVTSEVQRVTEALTQFGATTVEGGFTLTLPDDVLFDFNSTELRPDALQALALITEVLVYFDGDLVRVIGHTDSIGSDSYNQQLSELRAQRVVDALVSDHGISADRLTAEGRGESEPVAPNTTPEGEDNPEGRQLNRRVEILVLTERQVPLP